MTILSKRIFDKIKLDDAPFLQQGAIKVTGVNGAGLKVEGHAVMDIILDGHKYTHPIFVCEVFPDAILGQDFLLKHVSAIDYKRLKLNSRNSSLSCWIASEAEMSCRVEVSETTVIPPHSGAWIIMKIPRANKLAPVGMIAGKRDLPPGLNIPDCIIDTSEEVQKINVLNFSPDEVKHHCNMVLGLAESLYIHEGVHDRCASVYCDANADASNSQSTHLPGHLKDLWQRSSKHLSIDESADLAILLAKYQQVFATSSADLGRTSQVEHRINTGTACPIRQPPRRQPLGKREIEKRRDPEDAGTGSN
ncbi:uncharacterized protein LOC124290833 [Haliotis rubra]|uniref:uncharacterized protein LOC124290833 n=1 Tax=Haliotis rubra TaxID=36100 RepID=UPI001EE53C07|nr:uncharacterized protein LOC124290833 [Haliotis rubra]